MNIGTSSGPPPTMMWGMVDKASHEIERKRATAFKEGGERERRSCGRLGSLNKFLEDSSLPLRHRQPTHFGEVGRVVAQGPNETSTDEREGRIEGYVEQNAELRDPFSCRRRRCEQCNQGNAVE